MTSALAAPLCIAIAGGGIGGLAAALALQQAGGGGFNVQVFESAAAFEPLGAGIQLGPNAVRILQRWGLGPALQKMASFPERLEVRSALNGRALATLPLGEAVVLRHGSAHATLHRADLHELLCQALKINGDVQLHMGAALHSLAQDADAVEAGFAAADQGVFHIHADALIGADGLWSTVRKQMLPGGPPRSTKHQAFRILLPQAALPAALRSPTTMTAWLGPGLHGVSYPVRAGDWLNMVVIVQNQVLRHLLGNPVSLEEEAIAVDAMPAAQAVAAALATSSCCPLLRETVAAVGAGSSTGWQRWPLFDRAPMRSADDHVKGRVALLGDAAHPMRPYLAQGAAMAIEDAAALAECLEPIARSHPDNATARIPAALQLYAQQRWQRNAQVQARAERNGRIFHATGPVRWGRDAALRLLGARILDMPWLYSHGREAPRRFPGER